MGLTSYEETVANLKEAYAILCGGSEHDVGLSAYSAFRCQCAVKDALELLKAQEAVVRCKDCKHSCDYTDIYPDRIAYKCIKNGGYHNDDWFCADGERR